MNEMDKLPKASAKGVRSAEIAAPTPPASQLPGVTATCAGGPLRKYIALISRR